MNYIIILAYFVEKTVFVKLHWNLCCELIEHVYAGLFLGFLLCSIGLFFYPVPTPCCLNGFDFMVSLEFR